MPAYAILGAQWGDEGKGKIIDYLSQRANIVARFSGGNNAGHTVINDMGDFSLHLVPCGVFSKSVTNVIGNGVVVDPDVLIEEMQALEKAGIDISQSLMVSERAHLIMPYHVMLDTLAENRRGKQAIGTTGKGIGPAYSDKTLRTGIRAADILDLENLKVRLESVLPYTNAILEKIYAVEPVTTESILEKAADWKNRLGSYIKPVGRYVNDVLDDDGTVVLEGAQGILLDLDHGTYPFVTSSSPTIGGAITGLAIQPRHITSVLGIFKAYNTRVGSGPFPTELFDDVGESIRTVAREFGTTTGRPRRIGWFDGVLARYSNRVNGYTSAVVTRLDVLDHIDSIKVCVGYKLGTDILDEPPGGVAALEKCSPIYETLEGWDIPTAGISDLSNLPTNARVYIDRLENLIGCPIDIISTGPHRDQTIMVKDILTP
ncbi:MAG TPA: adenylosuccinate synthase [Dehalococcoidia bacterium]|nr:adenylosuccinate synthase [Chloroflexota bacterium]HCE76993.1 adenylosuccinate synthase [Dehalococcoidia bacterium]|tara:strand:- start:5557 stop:6849 length:1293 start_codon:yes stop_codon:yes gene_type:complete